jgi:hypothetical protein
MEHFWDLLYQLMKHGTNTLHGVFIFLFSVNVKLTLDLVIQPSPKRGMTAMWLTTSAVPPETEIILNII